MSRTKKIVIFVSLAAIAVGLTAVFITLAAVKFDLAALSTKEQYERKSVEAHQRIITDIEIEQISWDVKIVPTESKFCTVEYAEGEKVKDVVEITDGKLTVKQTDERKWYETVGIHTESGQDTTLILYLPIGDYGSISIQTTSGDVTVPRGVLFTEGEGGETVSLSTTFGSVTLKSTSGDLSFLAEVREGLSAKTTSGDLTLGHVMGGAVSVKTTSGEVALSDCTPGSLEIETTSGDVTLQNVRVAESAGIESTSGEVKLQSCYARDLGIRTTSGDVELRFDDGIRVETETTSGDVTLVPEKEENIGDGAICRVKTTSGDIYVSRPPIRMWAY